MSVSSEVQRTLVKSPPELWAELSDPTILARHLGELGEIRIVRTEPDRAVDWEAAATDGKQASGRVEIEPSGWGTRVTLSASRAITEAASPAESALEPQPKAQAEVEAEAITSVPVAPAVDPKPTVDPEPEAEAQATGVVPEASASDPEPEAAVEATEVVPEAPANDPEPEPEASPGFFARLFRRRKTRTSSEPVAETELITGPKPEPIVEPVPIAEPEPEPIAVEVETPSPSKLAPENTVPMEPAAVASVAGPDISAELAELEAQTTAVLTGVLDRLGAAHHRPFSRS